MTETTYGYAILALMLVLLGVGWRLVWPVWRRVREHTASVRALGPHGVLAMLVIIALAAALAFTLLTAAVLEASAAFRLDVAAASVSESLRISPLVELFSWVTHFGDTVTLLTAAVFGFAMYMAYARHEPLWPCLMTLLGAQATTWLGKYVIGKPRPDLSHIAPALQVVSPSFPSAHASGALTVYGFLGYLAIRTIRTPGHRAEAIYILFVYIGLIGLSRVFLGVHYATDVLGGWLLGAFWLCLGMALDMRARHHGSEAKASTTMPHP
ncbi:hypothetical protein DPQ33_07525 [Oceanidesulfovibrio indonesiensis]|uniref:Phosphatidic acid phosphatase type 2/haloperoxidase domain-containing protein n=1 Tax=Oceanidesulfovibrio indonesiensis TaxID=54767 RepID=A0A7M3MFX7_9BACT|nr:phosphatase PAP2 family protein [Oceanidesulfovibrio indonesiensis]TVM17951.1 hypothetical protein DPQ33_07525 [Oceanidesulfovibrio indonesiensis]